MAVIPVGRDHLVAVADRHLHADHHRLLTDIEVAEAADRAHAVQLTGFLLKAPDMQHFTIGL